MTAPLGRTTAKVETRCPNMREHVEAEMEGGIVVATPVSGMPPMRARPTCGRCYSVVVVEVAVPLREADGVRVILDSLGVEDLVVAEQITGRPNVAEPEWPCERREAHGPHETCPGVKAHPATMIGRRLR